MPTEYLGITSAEVRTKIDLLISAMVNIRDDTGEFLLTLPDGRVIDTKGWHDWEWTHGIGLYGIWQYYTLTNSAAHLAIIEGWFRDRFASGGTTKNINTMAVFLTLACVYERTRDPAYLPWLDGWAEWAYHDLPRTRRGGMQHVTYLEENRQQLWDDTLMMTVLPLAKIGLVLGRPHYVDEAKRQFLLHVQYLCDAKTGLFFHGWEFNENGAGGHHFAEARWARGNSWLTIAIPEFLELLREGKVQDPALEGFLTSVLQAQCEALKPLQSDATGLWRTLLDVPEQEGSYPEASATAGFAFGVLKGQRKRYIGQEFDDMAVKAVKGVLANISEDGELLNTSFGTAMGRDLQHYKDIPVTSMPYGQAMAIMALVEFLRRFI
ncbi:Unsaturated rhamnogalacturonyl hydrolase YesR [Madurella mycetomatis]|uniref:Unsaturated rhamnogalacturonyl hydrolase YesR n=1 Tax=Madurella mycetomatis TaxID=100816 RepID=A0A175WBV2_9PEZI|nr:Unsaturated rhamnogalacturonyl hydrolase YesR [Madurella mycetomatis]